MTTPLNTPPSSSAITQDLADRISRAHGVMFDIDGCLLLADQPGGYGGTLLPGAAQALKAVGATRRRFVCFTNGSFQTPSAIAGTLRELGLEVTDEQVMTPAVVAAETIARRYPGGRVLAFGGPGVIETFTTHGVELVAVEEAIAGRAGDVAAVVIGWDTEFGRSKIVAAAEAVLAGATLYATSDAPTFASHHRLNVGVSGFIAAGLSHVTGHPYRVLGKPSAEAFEAICARTGATAEELLIVGDDLQLETSMAVRHGATAVLMTTGTHSRQEAEHANPERRPDLILDSLDELAHLLRAGTTPSRTENS
ncbi:HAD-IIA family hydrolase [Citricoccus muralis]|uniref:HAD hydrolase-like protein n=1 Tax=Citricoccus muralis TaxID=169134 RepID=A0ABY8H460_9MICC|nr:HAD hydrolase-like protein [Citricoccus muralis]WFP15922.1 HAD hydrolase-like protein [Citricoccus muralis]